MVLPRPQVPPGPPQHSVLERCPLRCQVPSVNPPFCLSSGQVGLCRSASHPHRGPPQSPCKRSPPGPDPRARHPKLPQGQAISSDLAHAAPPRPTEGLPGAPKVPISRRTPPQGPDLPPGPAGRPRPAHHPLRGSGVTMGNCVTHTPPLRPASPLPAGRTERAHGRREGAESILTPPPFSERALPSHLREVGAASRLALIG